MTSLTKYNSKSELSFFDSFFGKSFLEEIDNSWDFILKTNQYSDVTEDEKTFTLKVFLPDMPKDKIEVNLINKNTIEVSAKNDEWSFYETYSYNSVDFSKSLPKLENGVLKLTGNKINLKVDLMSKKKLEII